MKNEKTSTEITSAGGVSAPSWVVMTISVLHVHIAAEIAVKLSFIII